MPIIVPSYSTSVSFKTNRDQVIQGALRILGALDPENTAGPTANQITNGSEALNMLLKEWETNGLQLWLRKYFVLFPQKGQTTYALGTPDAGGDHAVMSTPIGTNFVSTTVTSLSGTTLVVGSVSSSGTVGTPAVTVGDGWFIGIEQDSGYIFWTTANGAPSGNTITLASSSYTTVSNGNTVYAYQTKIVRPLRILDGFIRQTAGNDIPIRILSKEEYNRFGVKTSTGTPIQVMYDPQENTGYLYTYPTALETNQLLFVEASFPILDILLSGDSYDMPNEWGNALKFNLALIMAPEYEISDSKFKQIQYLAKASFTAVNGWDVENASVFFQPSYEGSYGSGGR